MSYPTILTKLGLALSSGTMCGVLTYRITTANTIDKRDLLLLGGLLMIFFSIPDDSRYVRYRNLITNASRVGILIGFGYGLTSMKS